MLRRQLQFPEHGEGQTHCDDIRDGVQNTHDLELQHQVNTRCFYVRAFPSAAHGVALQKDDQELNKAEGQYEDTDGPERDVKAVTGERASIEQEDGDFDAGYAGVVEFLDREGDLWIKSSRQRAFLVLKTGVSYFGDCHRVLEGDCMFGTAVRYGTDQNSCTLANGQNLWNIFISTRLFIGWKEVLLTNANSIIQSSSCKPTLILREMNRRITATIAKDIRTTCETITSPARFSLT